MIDPLYTVKEKYIPNRVLLAKNKNKSNTIGHWAGDKFKKAGKGFVKGLFKKKEKSNARPD